MKKTYDFFTKEDHQHFSRDLMTKEEAIKYAKKFQLSYEEVNEN